MIKQKRLLATGIVVFLVMIASLNSCRHDEKLNTEYSSLLNKIPEKAKVFAPGLVSTGMNERDFTMNPEMNEMYFTINEGKAYAIMVSGFDGKTWTKPKMISVNSDYNDIEPFISPDGKRLYFSSDRPVNDKNMGFDIWYAERKGDSWSAPNRLPEPVNTEKNEFYPSVSRNKNLYFTSHNDYIMKSEYSGGQYLKPEKLSDSVNTGGKEFNAFISPDENYLLFTSYGWPQNAGRGDLFISYQTSDGNWQKAQCLDMNVNSENLDFCPYVSPDGKALFFSSRRKPENQEKVTGYDSFQKIAHQPQNGKLDIYFISTKSTIR